MPAKSEWCSKSMWVLFNTEGLKSMMADFFSTLHVQYFLCMVMVV